MGVFKEEVKALEDLERLQGQIWPDAADQGVFATDDVKDTMRWVVKSLLQLPESRIVFSTDAPAVQRQYELTVYFSMEDGVTFDVLYYKGREEFFSISSRRAPSLVAPKQEAVLNKEYFNISDEELRVG